MGLSIIKRREGERRVVVGTYEVVSEAGYLGLGGERLDQFCVVELIRDQVLMVQTEMWEAFLMVQVSCQN